MLTIEVFDKRNILSEEKLKVFLGDDAEPDPLLPWNQVGQAVTKKDPISRFLYGLNILALNLILKANLVSETVSSGVEILANLSKSADLCSFESLATTR